MTTFVWHGKTLDTMGDVGDAITAIYSLPDEGERHAEAAAFMEAYRGITEHADANVGYWTGYMDHDTMVGMLRLFGVSHPVLGGPDEAAQITPAKAFAIGIARGSAMKAAMEAEGGAT